MNCPHHPNRPGLVYCPKCRAAEEEEEARRSGTTFSPSSLTPETDAFEANQHPSCRFPSVLEQMRKLERERNEWKANHDNQVELKRIMAARPDLAERAPMVERLIAERDCLRRTNEGLQLTFDVRWKADQRAIKRWQSAYPGNDLTWPDHADMVVWLMDQISPDAQSVPPERSAPLTCSACGGSGLGKPMYRPEIDKPQRNRCYTCKGTGTADVLDDFEARMMEMDIHELRSRILTQRDYLQRFHGCMDGLEIPDDCNTSIDGCRTHHNIRWIAEKLISRLPKAAVSHGDRERPPTTNKTSNEH